jgi:hypothetical protein
MLPPRAWSVIAAASAVALLAASPGRADAAPPPTFEITPFVGARAGGGFELERTDGTRSDVDLDSGASWGASLGLYRDAGGFYELLYSRQRASLDAEDDALRGVDVDVSYLQVGGTALFPQESRWVPYLSLTIGAARLEPTRGGYGAETKFALSLGGGFRLPLGERVAATIGVRGYLTLLDSDTKLFCLSTADDAGCLVESSGSTLFQGEGLLGLTVRF